MNEDDKKTIVDTISLYVPKARIYLFGSRARLTNTPQSDIDVAIDCNQKVDPVLMSEIKEKIEDSRIPFTVDLVDVHAISDELKAQILKDKIIWKE